MLKYLCEFIGTAIFLLVILQGSYYYKSKDILPLIIAVGLLTSIILFGKISGGHFNPAVSCVSRV